MKEWSRRDFLRAAGIGTAAGAILPFIPVPVARAAEAGIKRLVLFAHPNGTVIHRVRSNGTGAALVNGQLMPQLKGPVLAPLERHRSKVTFVDGLDHESGEIPRIGSSQRNGAGHHGVGIMWSGARLKNMPAGTAATDTAYSMSASIDQLLAASATTRIRSLVVGTSPTGQGSYNPSEGITAYSANGQPIPPEPDPRVVFDLLFAGGVDGTSIETLRRRASRRSILSGLKGELNRLRGELPSVDRERLDHHLEGVDDLDRRIAAATGPVCVAPVRAGQTSSTDVIDRLRLHVDIVKHAFACDLTRVANILQGSEGTSTYWLPPSELPRDPRTGDMHVASHETYAAATEADRRISVEIMSRLQRAMAEEFARLLDTLDAGPGPTLLSDTLAVWSTGMGWGGPHTNYSVPFVLASGSPKFAGGRYHRFGNYNLDIETSVPSNPWQKPTVITPHNRVLTSILHLMGRTDITAVGDPGLNGQQGGRDLDNSIIPELFA